jgi:S1-C subfamily serine protease
MRPGDVVLAVDDHQIRDDIDLTSYLARQQPGQRVRLTIWRSGREQVLTATLGEFPHEASVAAAPASTGRDTAAAVLGFTVEPVTPELADLVRSPKPQGVVIRAVMSDGPAAGLLVGMDACRAARSRNQLAVGEPCGMLLLSINGHAVNSPEDVARIAADLKPGTAVALRLYDSSLGEMVQNYRLAK